MLRQNADEVVVSHFDTQNPRFATLKSSAFDGRSVSCLFGEAKGRNLLIQVESAVSPSTTVTVEYGDSLFLGEVITCKPEDGFFAVSVKVDQVLNGLQSLMALRSALLSDSPMNAPRVSPFKTSQLTRAVA